MSSTLGYYAASRIHAGGGGGGLTTARGPHGISAPASGGAPTSASPASWSVTSGDLLTVAVGGEMGDAQDWDGAGFAVTGGGLTWTRVAAIGNPIPGWFQTGAAIFWAVATSTTSITDMAVNSTMSCLLFMYDCNSYRGQHATPIGATGTYFRHDFGGDDPDDTEQATLGSAPATSSYVLGVCYVNATDTSPDKAMTPGTSAGFVELYDSGPDSNGSGLWGSGSTQHRTGSTDPVVIWDDVKPNPTYATYSIAISAVEIKAA